MKKIILFTRLGDGTEYNAWIQVLCPSTQQAPIIEMRDAITLTINLGSALGILPYFDPDGLSSDAISRAKQFVTNLCQKIIQETDPQTVVAIHFGGGVTCEEGLDKWLNYLNDNNYSDATSILTSFRQVDQQRLTDYSINRPEIQFVQETLTNLESFYHTLRGEPSQPLLEAKLELLHTLLVPLRAADKKDFEGKMNQQIKGLQKYAGNHYNDAWSSFLKENPWTFYDKPFDQKYVALLSTLRDALLQEYEQVKLG
jgi:hypothetical protein